MDFVRRVLARPKRPEEALLANGGKPRRVVVCTIYFLDQQPNGSWADRVLGLLGYDSNPEKLKEAIRARRPPTEPNSLPLLACGQPAPHARLAALSHAAARLVPSRHPRVPLVHHFSHRGHRNHPAPSRRLASPRPAACAGAIHNLGHATIADVDGVEVVALPFFEHMDGTDANDYVQRVEPSSQGGKKMAAAIVDAVLADRPEGGWPAERLPNAYRGDGRGDGGCAIL